jgi:aryl-alcohol dehydrogenase-like predicted oxidoreductase
VELTGRVGFGAMRLTGSRVLGPPKDGTNARAVLRRVAELGVRLIDTADAYGPGHCEELIGAVLAPYPDHLIISTKGGFRRTPDGGWYPAGRPDDLRRACDDSLLRLRTERIGLYFLHTPDPEVPVAESVGALDELRRAGKVRAIGVSNVSTAQLAEACAVAPVAAVQNRLNLNDRASLPVLRQCERAGLVFLAYTPLADGGLPAAAAEVARRHGTSPRQVALAWLLATSPVVVPIPGTRQIVHLEENVAAAGLELSEPDLRLLDGGPAPASGQ